MESSEIIRKSVDTVSALRQETSKRPKLLAATKAIKCFQSRRFGSTYQDLLLSPDFSAPAHFFLRELYSDKDFTSRDAQFARIASAIETLFPKQVVSTAVALAELHALTEDLDHQLAVVWAEPSMSEYRESERYVRAWKAVGRRTDRERQLSDVLQVGAELDRLTQKPGLRTLLRMMRRPAEMAGLGALQFFLEEGFDTFAKIAGKESRAKVFLETINERETYWISLLFSADTKTCESALTQCVGS